MPKNAAAKLISTGITLLVALALLAGTTFAWFTISANPEISGVSFLVSSRERMLLALDDPNVTDPNELEFSETIDLSEIFKYYYDLTPVSTADGIHWFIPQYDTKTGNLLDPDKFIMDDKLEYANSFVVSSANGEVLFQIIDSGGIEYSSAISLTAQEMLDAQKKGYYVYTDIWIKTESESGADVRLTYPDYDTEKIRTNDELDGWFGTYVLPLYDIYKDQGENIVAQKKSRNAESSMRVGFQIFGTSSAVLAQPTATSSTAWYIYEPNGDLRSNYALKPEEYGGYVVNYGINSSAYSNGIYIETRPIGYTSSATVGITDNNGNPVYVYEQVTDSSILEANNGQNKFYFQTVAGSAGTYTEISGNDAYPNFGTVTYYIRTQKQRLKATPVSLSSDNLIVQMAGEWDLDSTDTQSKFFEDPVVPLNSNDVKTFGKFLSTYNLYQKLTNLRVTHPDTDAVIIPSSASIFECDAIDEREGDSLLPANYSSCVLLHLNYNEPQKIRIFIWVEGQDPDCWNDIAAGGFRLNLEFSGKYEND